MGRKRNLIYCLWVCKVKTSITGFCFELCSFYFLLLYSTTPTTLISPPEKQDEGDTFLFFYNW